MTTSVTATLIYVELGHKPRFEGRIEEFAEFLRGLGYNVDVIGYGSNYINGYMDNQLGVGDSMGRWVNRTIESLWNEFIETC